jgi:hypothetical protein
MAATRQYRRKSNGQFAGASGGTKVTTGRAGGFANSAFRSRVAASRLSGNPRSSTTTRPGGGKRGSARRKPLLSNSTKRFIKQTAKDAGKRGALSLAVNTSIVGLAVGANSLYAKAGGRVADHKAGRGKFAKNQLGAVATRVLKTTKLNRKGVYKITKL